MLASPLIFETDAFFFSRCRTLFLFARKRVCHDGRLCPFLSTIILIHSILRPFLSCSPLDTTTFFFLCPSQFTITSIHCSTTYILSHHTSHTPYTYFSLPSHVLGLHRICCPSILHLFLLSTMHFGRMPSRASG
ncbi:hypothetical protein BDQ12DRAFT_346045 [Crucibulum laeve]|uniref:Uncharacterized protein n=1 Tax=Crucibulum laeve TaxID=68775 RepID=A0A5C3MAX5_9AGAR|nr:hypothetical protein BDQ12DRAFT_346045 [Crucibulum laeve]